jgi:hypothetical protein
MPATKILPRIIAFVLCSGLFLLPARGEDLKTGDVQTNVPAITAQLQPEVVPGFPPITRVIASVGTNKFAFLAPRSFRVDASNPQKIILTSTNEITFITVSVLHPAPKETSTEKKVSFRDTCRELLLAEHPGGKILSEFTRSADGRSGPAFDLQCPVPAGGVQSARVAFIPTPVGVLEFELITRPDLFRSAGYKLNNVILSFRVSKNGKLKIVPLSNKF